MACDYCRRIDSVAATDWFGISRRNARSVQATIGWIFWDPGAGERYQQAGLPEAFAGPLGYVAARCAPLAIRGVFQFLETPDRFREICLARDAAVVDGLGEYAPDIVDPLIDVGPALWQVVERLPVVGRVFFGAHLATARPTDALLLGWHAVNCLREWRGDTHWALVVAEGLTHAEASILHNAWLGYETDWLATSRGTSAVEIDLGWNALVTKGLALDRTVLPVGIAFRQRLEDATDTLTMLPWQFLGEPRSIEFSDRFELPCRKLLARVDETAGVNYQPASRIRA